MHALCMLASCVFTATQKWCAKAAVVGSDVMELVQASEKRSLLDHATGKSDDDTFQPIVARPPTPPIAGRAVPC